MPSHVHAAPPTAARGGFLAGLFETFTPRRVCMNDEPDVIWLHFGSDLLITAAYFSIPVALVYFARRRKDLAYNWMFLLFALFIVLCGTTHLFNIWALWQPLYRLDGVVKLLTGVASVATAALLWRLIPHALALPGRAELTRRKDELERLVAERTEDLTRANQALRDADHRKNEFLAMLAHELRNPLASIGNAAQLMRMPGAAATDVEWSRATVERQVRHLARMIDDLMDAARVMRGMVELKKRPLDVADVVADAVALVRPQVVARGQHLSVALEPGTLWCEADPTRLEQVVVNLLSNAVKYTQPGGRIGLSAQREGAQVAIRVRDDGMGIPPDQLDVIFGLFVQGARSIARSEGGLGIGLTLVRRIAEMHGGSATAASAGPGLGSEFTVTLPALAGPPRPETPPTHAGPARAERARILIVDDSADTAQTMARLLGLLGHEIRTAHDGPSALADALAFRPDFVLLDIGLPGIDGYEVARRLRAQGLADAVIIAITGYGQEEDRRRSHAAGCDHHLVKPVDCDTLLSLIAEPG